MTDLEKAWIWRKQQGCWADTQALRVFHGPGEGQGGLERIAIEIFGDYAWVISWGEIRDSEQKQLVDFLKSREDWTCRGVICVARPERGVPEQGRVLFGEMPSDGVVIQEQGARFKIRFHETRQPGLFLDHAPLRRWLRARACGWRVLNTFAYTGSLSVVCGLGGAKKVTTLDLSKPTVEWAKENWALNELSESQGDWIFGDALEWMSKWIKRGERFDCVILDPPSFSRGGKKGNFSTEKDFKQLCEMGMSLLTSEGILVASMNSAKIPQAKIEQDLIALARENRVRWQVLGRMDLPDTFPTRIDAPADRYLKGMILKRPE